MTDIACAAGAQSISAHAARQPNTAALGTEKPVLGHVLLASHRLREGARAPLCSSAPARRAWRGLSRSGWLALSVGPLTGLAQVQEP
jgi:hypothetical protein